MSPSAGAVVREPKLFLFDEPLSNLDAALRVNTRLEIAQLHRRLKATMIYVTHDQVEAMTLADKIVVLNAGRSSRSGADELYNSPANEFVAGFIGSPKMNFIDAAKLGEGQAKTIGVRPEHLTVDAIPAHGKARSSTPNISAPTPTSISTPRRPGSSPCASSASTMPSPARRYP